jgi:hypothetical protein
MGALSITDSANYQCMVLLSEILTFSENPKISI